MCDNRGLDVMYIQCVLDFKWIHVNATNWIGCAFDVHCSVHVNRPLEAGRKAGQPKQNENWVHGLQFLPSAQNYPCSAWPHIKIIHA